MLLITGPSGNVGRHLVEVLVRNSDMPIRVAARHPEKLEFVRARSVEAVTFDFRDRATWLEALRGVTSLFLLFPLPNNRDAREAIIPFVQAAERSGCTYVAYISVIGAEKARFLPHDQVEVALRDSTMTWTVLRCGFFMQNLHRSISTHGFDIVVTGELFVPAGNGRTTFLDARDVAEVAASVLTKPDKHQDVIYTLTGREALTMTEVAQLLTIALGKPVRYTKPGVVRFARRLRRRGVGTDVIAFMAAVYTLTRLGLNATISADIEVLLGREATSMYQFLDETVWRWRERLWT